MSKQAASKFLTIDIKKYGGKQVAIVDGKIVASGLNTKALLASARGKVPKRSWQKITLFSVPPSLYVIYRL